MTKKEIQKLKRLSRNWSSKEWEEYLKTLEHGLSESLIHPKRYKRLRKQNSFLWDSSGLKNSPYKPYIPYLRRALKKLSPKQREALRLLFWEGLSYRSVALKLKLAPNAVLKRKTLAIQKFREKLRSYRLNPLNLNLETSLL